MNPRKWYFLAAFFGLLFVSQPIYLQESAVEAPDSLTYYDGSWQDAIGELEDIGLIAEGGELIFEEDRAFFDGQGNFFTPLARNQPRADVVMAGELTFATSASNEYESCSLLARIVMDGNNASRYLEVGLSNEERGFYFDLYGDRNNDNNYGAFSLVVDLEESHDFLFLAINDRLTMYFDGELVLEDELIDDRSGSFGIGLIGRGAGARCEGKNIWAYEAPVVEPGVCEVTADGTVNRRSGPGTGFDRAGTMTSENVLRAIAQETGDDGFIWWQLEDESWVRDDIVNARGACSSLPGPDDVVTATEEPAEKDDSNEAGEKDAEVTEEATPEATPDATTEEEKEEGDGLNLSERVEQLSNADFDCTVRTDQPNFASVRVGPGTNRTAILFLPADRDFDVLGQATATADNGELWWKLDKEQVSSRTSANELWVAQGQVEASSGCDEVPFVEAPPIIEIVVATAVLPESGQWILDPQTVAIECPNGFTVINWESPSFPIDLVMSGDGSVMTVGLITATRTETGVYVGQDDYFVDNDIISTQETYRVADANRIVLEAVGSYLGCTVTFRSELTH